jgi:hypothetical protein
MDYITSEKNKDFLWNLLYENQIFVGIPNTKWNDVKALFESVILNISNNTKNENVLEINKEILSSLNPQILNLKKTFHKSKNIKDEFSNEKIETFDKNLETHRNSLDELIKPNKPQDIDFADKTDITIDNTEMDRIIEEMQKERNITLNENTQYEDVPKLKIESLKRPFEADIVELGNIDLIFIHKRLTNILENQEKIMKKLNM